MSTVDVPRVTIYLLHMYMYIRAQIYALHAETVPTTTYLFYLVSIPVDKQGYFRLNKVKIIYVITKVRYQTK